MQRLVQLAELAQPIMAPEMPRLRWVEPEAFPQLFQTDGVSQLCDVREMQRHRDRGSGKVAVEIVLLERSLAAR